MGSFQANLGMRFPALILVRGVTSSSLGFYYPLDMTDLTNATGHSIHWYMYIEPLISDFADHDGTRHTDRDAWMCTDEC